MTLVFLVTEWLILTGTGSFVLLSSLRGVLIAPLIAGIFPVLLLVASRQKGEVVPGVVYRFLGQPWLLASIYLLFMASIFLHGLVIWQDLGQRIVAIMVGLLMVGATIAIVRRGAFARRMAVELQADQRQGERANFAIRVAGQPATMEVKLDYGEAEQQVQAAAGELKAFASLRYIKFQLPPNLAREFKVWAHRITPEGDSENLPAFLITYGDDEKKEFDLMLLDGQVVMPLDGQICRIEIRKLK